jgi:hypothetical protein
MKYGVRYSGEIWGQILRKFGKDDESYTLKKGCFGIKGGSCMCFVVAGEILSQFSLSVFHSSSSICKIHANYFLAAMVSYKQVLCICV